LYIGLLRYFILADPGGGGDDRASATVAWISAEVQVLFSHGGDAPGGKRSDQLNLALHPENVLVTLAHIASDISGKSPVVGRRSILSGSTAFEPYICCVEIASALCTLPSMAAR
jgi:hypothetical protein